MTRLLDKLNLRPQERRLVVIVAVVVFIVLNIWLVFPNFGELGRTEQRIKDAKSKIDQYEAEIRNEKAYKKRIDELAGQGAIVASEQQALNLAVEVDSQATLSQLNIQSRSSGQRAPSGGRTNAFFEEQTYNIGFVNTGEKELVDFLYNLGAQGTLIRVKSMNISPEPSQMKLQGNLTLVKSFQKKAPAKPAVVAASAPKTNPPAKPAAAPPPKEKAKEPPKTAGNPPPATATNVTKRTPPKK